MPVGLHLLNVPSHGFFVRLTQPDEYKRENVNRLKPIERIKPGECWWNYRLERRSKLIGGREFDSRLHANDVAQCNCFTHPCRRDRHTNSLANAKGTTSHTLGIIRVGSTPLIAVAQTAKRSRQAERGRDPKLFLYSCRQDKTLCVEC